MSPASYRTAPPRDDHASLREAAEPGQPGAASTSTSLSRPAQTTPRACRPRLRANRQTSHSNPVSKPIDAPIGTRQTCAMAQDPLSKLIAQRVGREPNLDGRSDRFDRIQRPLWTFLNDYYFRLEVGGWERIPEEPSLLIGIHSGGSLTMDAWTLIEAWQRH